MLKTNCIIILGMHRSGTSCLAGALQDSDLYLGEVSKNNLYNTKGNRENNKIMDLNNSILAHNNGSWDHPPPKLTWMKKHEKEGLQIINSFLSVKKKHWGFKDPRTLITYSFWKKIIPKHQLIGTFRHPLNVVKSLQIRDANLTKSDALELWYKYNRCLIQLHKQASFPIISFDSSEEKYNNEIRQLRVFSGLKNSKKAGFFEKRLRSHAGLSDTYNSLPPHIHQCYKQLLSAHNTGG